MNIKGMDKWAVMGMHSGRQAMRGKADYSGNFVNEM